MSLSLCRAWWQWGRCSGSAGAEHRGRWPGAGLGVLVFYPFWITAHSHAVRGCGVRTARSVSLLTPCSSPVQGQGRDIDLTRSRDSRLPPHGVPRSPPSFWQPRPVLRLYPARPVCPLAGTLQRITFGAWLFLPGLVPPRSARVLVCVTGSLLLGAAAVPCGWAAAGSRSPRRTLGCARFSVVTNKPAVKFIDRFCVNVVFHISG